MENVERCWKIRKQEICGERDTFVYSRVTRKLFIKKLLAILDHYQRGIFFSLQRWRGRKFQRVSTTFSFPPYFSLLFTLTPCCLFSSFSISIYLSLFLFLFVCLIQFFVDFFFTSYVTLFITFFIFSSSSFYLFVEKEFSKKRFLRLIKIHFL